VKKSNKKLWLGLILILALVGWAGYKQLRSWLVTPEAILVLGGAEERERYAANLAKQHPQLSVWVSSGSPQWYARKIFHQQGIEIPKYRHAPDRQIPQPWFRLPEGEFHTQTY